MNWLRLVCVAVIFSPYLLTSWQKVEAAPSHWLAVLQKHAFHAAVLRSRTLRPFNVSTYCIPPHPHPPTDTASLPHSKTAKQSSPSFIWTYACFNHPATPSQMSDNALSPSFLTQIMGFSNSQTCIYFKRIYKILVFMRICGCCKSKKRICTEKMFLTCCFTCINTFQ